MEEARPDVVVVGHSHVVGLAPGGALVESRRGRAPRLHSARTAFVLAREGGGEWRAWRIDLGARGRPRGVGR
ncbi:MAG: hypothetical protein U0470_06200 [Anaerolineae bacterium]